MSVDLFYPDNRNRATRVEQLANDIAGMQRNVILDEERLKLADGRMKPLMDKLLEENGMTTYTELLDKIAADLTEEEAKAMNDLLKEIKETNQNLEQAFGVTLIISCISGSVFAGPKMIRKLVSVTGLKSAIRLSGRSINLAIKGFMAESKIAAKAANHISKVTAMSFEVSASVGTACRYIKIASKVLTILGFVTEAILIFLAAYEGAKQKEQLREATKEYFSKRINIALLEELTTDLVSFEGSLETILDLHDDFIDEDYHDDLIKTQTDKLAGKIEDLWETRTHESSAEVWGDIDKSRQSWMDEDPTVKDAIIFLDSMEDEEIEI